MVAIILLPFAIIIALTEAAYNIRYHKHHIFENKNVLTASTYLSSEIETTETPGQ